MLFRLCLLVSFLLTPLLLGAVPGLPKLIPRTVLFGNPVKGSPRISPDGTRLSYLAPSPGGVQNVWVRTLGRADDTQVTADTHRGIRSHFWAEDNLHLLYLQDQGGDENYHLFSVDLRTKVVRDLTPFQGIKAAEVFLDPKHPNELLVGLNLRDRTVFDLHRLELTTGALVLDTENPGDVVSWLVDPQFQVRAAFAQSAKDASTTVRVRQGKMKPWKDLLTWPFGENGAVLDFGANGKTLFVETSLGTDTTRLVTLDTTNGKELKTLAADPSADLGEVLIHPEHRRVQAVGFNYLQQRWQVVDKTIEADFAALAKLGEGEFSLISRDRADRLWIVALELDDGPMAWYLYRRDTRAAELLFVNRPDLAGHTLAKYRPVEIPTSDGLKLVSYLTLPVGVPEKNLPLVLFVHGGPWGRDTWGFDPTAQWLANRGYAVLQVNFRGSTGFGKRFLNAGNRGWGVGAMQRDLTEAVAWAVNRGLADPKKIGIYGGSYGGYAVLAGLTFTPDVYACGVDLVGPSNLRTLFQAIPPYWEPFKREFVLRVGDVEADDALNRALSPLYHAAKIRAPLLVGQGANDPRVNIAEAEQIVEAMRKNKLAVQYVVYADEGHGFARPDNRLDFYGRVEEFLAKHLGGRVEARHDIPGSSAQVR